MEALSLFCALPDPATVCPWKIGSAQQDNSDIHVDVIIWEEEKSMKDHNKREALQDQNKNETKDVILNNINN